MESRNTHIHSLVLISTCPHRRLRKALAYGQGSHTVRLPDRTVKLPPLESQASGLRPSWKETVLGATLGLLASPMAGMMLHKFLTGVNITVLAARIGLLS